MSWIVAEDRETGALKVLGRPDLYESSESGHFGGRRRKVWRYSTYIKADIRSSPFWKNIRVVEDLPEGAQK